jgi:hypothetical protein
MILTKYRMFIENGYIETLDIEEAKLHGNYVIVEEEIEEEELI